MGRCGLWSVKSEVWFPIVQGPRASGRMRVWVRGMASRWRRVAHTTLAVRPRAQRKDRHPGQTASIWAGEQRSGKARMGEKKKGRGERKARMRKQIDIEIENTTEAGA